MGWCYEEVDPETGRTPLDILYEEHLQRIKAVFEHPLPPLPRDGTASPDFLVGFAHYDYRLRDQYRAVIARALDVSVSEVRLSVAWSGRFNVSQFNRVQKVCGVCVRPSVSAVPSKSSSSSFSRMTAEGGHQAQEHFDREHDLSKKSSACGRYKRAKVGNAYWPADGTGFGSLARGGVCSDKA
ncbi:hypothetical protein ERJ75_000430600 [Trypanosoma vivax]|nr:hypothetical protein ERJ75_000430600 [Trypanosoma vivax]